ncbi:MAG: AAA family ATPase [Acidobacteriaceae bacterium]
MTIFVGVAGTHSTGKTSLVQDVLTQAEKCGVSVEVVGDTATKCREAGFPILTNHTFESTLWIMTSVIKAELEAGLKASLVLVDRPVPDALGYLEAALSTTGRTITEQQSIYLYNLAEHHAKCYSLLLKTQLDESIPLGPDRDPNLDFRRDVDRCIDAAFSRLSIDCLDPHSIVAQERIRSILDQLSSTCLFVQ